MPEYMVAYYEFLPTLPARGATVRLLSLAPKATIFLPTLPARGATRAGDFLLVDSV